jgi:class 3 adenylate cyclase/tetratricopeptide (TPR) repeat protein
MRCSACGTENEPGRKFCGECGAKLAAVCAACGTANTAGTKFCGECGAPMGDVPQTPAAAVAPDGPSGREAPEAERRLVSVLFADLVGFTTLSESRDAEEVRDLLTRYFDTCRQLIDRYGGTVEKFIGDAVMAVWGTPIAKEEDAERAVRTALDLTEAVAALGQEAGAPDLRARAGVLTGEAVVSLGAAGQGMVAGDMVNTASRIQSTAAPGQVFVGEATKRSTEAAIVYEDAGTHELKGKAEPVPLWRAVRVIGGLGGAQRSVGLEAPFVGRDRDLRVIKEMFHASAEEHRAHLVSVIGIAGTGKSRLMWEFNKYIDGLAGDVRWHRGRCLPYGQGVTYWALAEMVRTRTNILEGESPSTALGKLHTAVEETMADPEERAWVEPRLAHLLGLEEGTSWDRESLFSAWRLFYERLSEQMPTVMVFEDMQWADASLLDFVEYLLEWSKSHALFVLALARPDLFEQHPTWGSASRNSTMLSLEPLPEGAMEALLAGLVPGLPDELRSQIFARAEGVPLYAVETVRMLMDRGLLVQEGASYRPSGPIDLHEIPETLHALIAARLDGLSSDERLLIQDGAVLGKTFRVPGLAALSGLSESEIEPMLSSLVKKEVLSLQADPVSPERGQYGFLQELVRRVAYETLSKKDRRDKHLAAARFIEGIRGQDEEEFIEIVATHYLEAWRAARDAADAGDIKDRARDSLTGAGERAASLAAHVEAQRYFEEAAELANDPASRAKLIEHAGMEAQASGATDVSLERFEAALELLEREGLTHPAARVSARMGQALWDRGRLGDAVDRMEASFEVLSGEEPDEDLAILAHQLGRMDFFAGRIDRAEERTEAAIDIAEGLWLPDVLSNALNTKAVILYSARARRREGFALLKYALELALENDLPIATMRAYFNISDLAGQSDRFREGAEYVEKGLALARRLGNRDWEWRFLGQVYCQLLAGEWDTALEMVNQIPVEKVPEARLAASAFLLIVPVIQIARGDIAGAEEAFAIFPDVESSADLQESATQAAGRAVLHRARGEAREALDAAREVLANWADVGTSSEPGRESILVAIEAAFDLGDLEAVDELLGMIDAIPRGKQPHFLQAQASRFRGRLAAARGRPDEAESLFKGATGLLREIESPFSMAVTLVEHAEWLAEQGRSDEAGPLLAEAHEIFERLKAKPWLERVEKLLPSEASIA